MTQELLVMDVANVYLRDLETRKIVGTTTTSSNAINATLEQDVLRAGWGGGVVATINSSKLVELTFEDVFFSMDYLAMQQGTEVEQNQTGKVLQHFGALVQTDGTDDFIEVPSDVTASIGYVTDAEGEQHQITITPSGTAGVKGKAILPAGHGFKVDDDTVNPVVIGDEITVYYEKTITGKKVTIDSAKFPKFVEVVMHTRAFSPETNKVVEDIYAQLDKCQVGGNSTIELGVNTPVPTQMTFTAINKNRNTTELGRFWQVERPATP